METQGDKDANFKGFELWCKNNASAHGYNITELKMREELLALIKSGAFERYIVLSSKNGPGTLEEVVNSHCQQSIGGSMIIKFLGAVVLIGSHEFYRIFF